MHEPQFTMPNDGVVEIKCSPSETYISFFWVNTGKYGVYMKKSWKCIDEGITEALAWSSTSNRYALITGGKKKTLGTSQKAEKKKRKKDKSIKTPTNNPLTVEMKEIISDKYWIPLFSHLSFFF